MTDAPASPDPSALLRRLATPLGAFCAIVAALLATARFSGPYSLAGFLAIVTLLMIVAGLIVVAAHELGHLVVSRLVGFRTVSLTIGPLRLLRTRRGVRVRSADSWRMSGGMLICLPRTDEGLRWRWMSVVAAGPAASLLLAPVAFLASRWLLDSSHPTLSLSATLLLPAVALVSLVAGVGSLIPGGHGLLLSDGAQIRMLLRGGAHAERLCAQIALTAAARDGVRPREWSRVWVGRVTALRDDTPQEAIGHLGAFYWALDSGHSEDAAAHLARARALLTHLAPLLRALVELDTAFFEARVRRDAPAAREALGRASAPGIPRFALLRSEAAVLLAEGDRERALASAGAALTALRELEGDELVRFPAEEEWIRTLMRDAEDGAGPEGQDFPRRLASSASTARSSSA